MTQSTETIRTVASGSAQRPVPSPAPQITDRSTATEARAGVDRIVALNANLLAAA